MLRCASGIREEAIELLNRDRTVEITFSDIVMPGMNGLELARFVREHHPDIGIVLASGYSEKATAAIADGFPLLQKPYTRDSLRAALVQARVKQGAAA